MRSEEIRRKAVYVLGEQEQAEAWLNWPARDLDYRMPIDVMRYENGRKEVYDLLLQMEYWGPNMTKDSASGEVLPVFSEAIKKSKKTMREWYPDAPFLPDSVDRPRYKPPIGTVDHLRSRLIKGKIIAASQDI